MASSVNVAKASRDTGIDAFRFAMAMLVICLHVLPYSPPGSIADPVALHSSLVRTLARCAVPFFFVTSGYYLRFDRPLPSLIWRPLRRIFPIWVVWYIGYRIVADALHNPWSSMNWKWYAMLVGSSSLHLWFLPALAFSVILVGIGLKWLGRLPTLIAVVLIAIVGLLLSDYLPLFLNMGVWQEQAIVRLLAAPAFVYIGTEFRRRGPISVSVALGLATAGFLLSVGEEIALTRLSGHSGIYSYDVVLSTFILGPAMFLLARALNDSTLIARVSPLGRLSLGIYLIHLGLVWAVLPHVHAGYAVQLAVVAILSTVAAFVLARIPFVKSLVT